MPYNLQPDDVLVLTKPLGTQLAVNLFQWFKNQNASYHQIKHLLTQHQIHYIFLQAVKSMATLNL